MFFNREPVPLLDPDKQFTEGGMPIGLTALDYWRFQFSNVWDAQEEVAEFIVAKALGMDLPFNKNGWTSCDIMYNGKRVEIIASAYFHSWRGDGKVSKTRNFGIPKAFGQHNVYTAEAERKNDVYVFCLNLGDGFENSDPFEMSHWEFYVVRTSIINEKFGDADKISLSQVKKLTKSVPYSRLKSAVEDAFDK